MKDKIYIEAKPIKKGEWICLNISMPKNKKIWFESIYNPFNWGKLLRKRITTNLNIGTLFKKRLTFGEL